MSKIKIIPLGGAGEQGKNMVAVDVDGEIYIFDAGIKYPVASMFGVDYIISDFEYLKNNKEKIKGIFITNSNEENMGAAFDVIKALPNVSIYGSKYTITSIKNKNYKLNESTNLIEIEPHKTIKFGVNSIYPISVTYNVPGALLYVLNTSDGAVVYTGNFVFDSATMKQFSMDVGKLAYVGKQGVLALISESTYSEKSGFTAPKNRISKYIKNAFYESEARTIFSLYHDDAYRICELLNETKKTKRKIVILGSQLYRTIITLINGNVIDFNKDDIGTIADIRNKNSVILIGNDRYNPYVYLKKILSGFDRNLKINGTDSVVFLENSYLGTEKAYIETIDKFSRLYASVITLPKKDVLMHNASREDLLLMLNLMNPSYYIPIKGNYKLQFHNKEAALLIGKKEENIILPKNGDVITFENGKLISSNEKIKVDDILIDGNSSDDVGELVIRDRQILSDNGIVVVTTTISKNNNKILAGPDVQSKGFIYVKENIEIMNEIKNISKAILDENITETSVAYSNIKSEIRSQVTKYLFKETGARPMVISIVQKKDF
ncbi:MAG: ribonuclease J [Bacilli bacterium]